MIGTRYGSFVNSRGGAVMLRLSSFLNISPTTRTHCMVATTTSTTNATFRVGVTSQQQRTTTSTTKLATTIPFASITTNHVGGWTLSTAALAVTCLSVGFVAGQTYQPQQQQHASSGGGGGGGVLPNGLPRTCCEDHDHPPPPRPKTNHVLTPEQIALSGKLQRIVGAENVLDGRYHNTHTDPFLKGARLGSGTALCIVTPRHLHDIQDIVQAVVDAECVILPQGQNTGLTGGSVPHFQSDNHRPVVVLSMKYLNRIFPLDHGDRVCCLAGVGLASLGQFFFFFFPDRQSHSILGSTFLNPTTAAGVAFGSGGTQMRKGPAYTERALYLKIYKNKWNENVVETVNTLNIEGMEERDLPPQRARKMDRVAYHVDTWSRWVYDGYERDMHYTKAGTTARASQTDYAAQLCQFDSNVSRFNANTDGPDPNRSEGKVIILATVHDTFPKPAQVKTYWLGFDSLETALAFRQQVCLNNPRDLPISCEYLDRDAIDVIDQAGRILGLTIQMLGTSSTVVRQCWNLKLWLEALPFSFAPTMVDQLMYMLNPIVPNILPRSIQRTAREMDHHVAVTVGEFGGGTLSRFQQRMDDFVQQHGTSKVVVHECKSPWHTQALTAFRFVSAPAFRTWCVGNRVQGISVDYVLPKNGGIAPPLIVNEEKEEGADVTNKDSVITTTAIPIKRMRYSHFGCNVVHEDLAYAQGVDVHQAKHALKDAVEQSCHGKLPAEHGHGTEYVAPVETQKRWMRMDPLNVLNPGVGGLSEHYAYQEP